MSSCYIQFFCGVTIRGNLSTRKGVTPNAIDRYRNAKPEAKEYKMFDERGLFLIVTPTGGKWWRLKYRYDSKEKLLSLGAYPDVGLKAPQSSPNKSINCSIINISSTL